MEVGTYAIDIYLSLVTILRSRSFGKSFFSKAKLSTIYRGLYFTFCNAMREIHAESIVFNITTSIV